MSEFCFHSISGEQMDRISPNFVYAFILTISRLGFVTVTCIFVTELWPLIDVRIFFPAQCLQIFLLNIFRTWPFLLHKKRCNGAIVRFSDLCKQFGPRTSDLIWIQTVWDSDCIPDFFLKKLIFKKISRWTKKHEELPRVQSVNIKGKHLNENFFWKVKKKTVEAK